MKESDPKYPKTVYYPSAKYPESVTLAPILLNGLEDLCDLIEFIKYPIVMVHSNRFFSEIWVW